jgi:uncharacterized LabA/DUF88 family protein
MLLPEFHFVDGENLVLRYQAMLESGRTARPGVIHERDAFVWHPDFVGPVGDIRRINYYTSIPGDDQRVIDVAKRIRAIPYSCSVGQASKEGTVVPHVFKKAAKSRKSRAVDVNIVIDSLRHAGNGSAGHVVLYSGDADFIPLIEELMHIGVQVHVKAFSSGLSPLLSVVPDEFYSLDERLFNRDQGQ